MKDDDEIRRRLDALQAPGPVKVRSSLRVRCEDRARETFATGLEASGLSQRAMARRLGVCERIVRDYLSGARAVPLWALLALPRAGQLGAVRAQIDSVPTEGSEPPESQRGAA